MPQPEDLLLDRTHRFELGALLDALAALGYPPEAVLLRSHWSNASARTLIESLSFASPRKPSPDHPPLPPDVPERFAIIELNTGLLSAQTPLPPYMLRMMEDIWVDDELFAEFVHFFDHVLLTDLFSSLQPERTPILREAGPQMQTQLLQQIGLASLSMLHWLFSLFFPDLQVDVQREGMSRTVRTEDVVLGETVLSGSTILGGAASLPVPGFCVDLLSEDEESRCRRYWPEEVGHRLQELVYPVLEGADLMLRIRLTIPIPEGAFQLGRNRLGYSPMEQETNTVVVEWFYGTTSDEHPLPELSSLEVSRLYRSGMLSESEACRLLGHAILREPLQAVVANVPAALASELREWVEVALPKPVYDAEQVRKLHALLAALQPAGS